MGLEPAKIAEFRIAGALGAGTTARVYDAVHTATGRPVAIKVLEPSHSGGEMRERFAREAVLLSGVSSRHVGRIEGFGFDRGQPFLVLERLVGETLDAKLRRDGPVPLRRALPWIEQLIVGVRDCHEAKVIHRDIKPSNIYVHQDGGVEIVKLIDFGVARLLEIAGATGLTSTNHLIGSMGYMAPEQFANAKTVGFTADLYALGVVVFRTLTGRLPFVNRSLPAVIKMKVEQDAPAISSMPGMPKNPMLDWFVGRAMARDPGARFQSAREMLEQWWSVMGSLEEEDATSVMQARRGEALSAPLRRAMTEPITESPPLSERTVHDVTPRTLPSPHITITAPARLDDVDPFDVPTKNDPNLRKLVERELELHKKRKRGR